MKIFKAQTRQGENLVARARVWEGETLYKVYSNPSPAKVSAFYACKECCYVEGGRKFHICSHNTFSYSVAWETAQGVRVVTSNNSYLVVGGVL